MTQPASLYGGQAVLEGVMMRGVERCAVAVRAPDERIVLNHLTIPSASRPGAARLPFVRGLFVLWDSLSLGFRALTFSANVQAGDAEPVEGPAMTFSLILSMAFAIVVFFLLPTGVGYALERWLSLPHGAVALVEGAARLALLIGYVAAIGRVEEIRRVYAYHGAEHMTINAFEARDPSMTPESIARYPRQHARCGTAFLLTVVIFSIILFTLLGPMPIGLRLVSQLLMIPLVAGVSYEYIRWTGKHQSTGWAKVLLLPNIALQNLTTRQPEPEMIEVALSAFEALRNAEGQPVLRSD